MRANMKKLFFFFLVAILLPSIGYSAITDSTESQYLNFPNLVPNPGFENGKATWIFGAGPTSTITSTAADVGAGLYALSWDATAASQTLNSKLTTVPSGSAGQACLARIKYKGGTAITWEVRDASTTLASTTIGGAGSYTDSFLSFTCPTGQVRMRFTSTVDEAALFLDDTYIGENYQIASSTSEGIVNFLDNANFLFWQRGTSTTLTNGQTKYLADRWYAHNTLGTNGVLTYSQVVAGTDAATFGAKVQITTAPTALQANGTALLQTIDQPESKMLYNKTASLQVKVKCFGNVDSIGIAFLYATTAVKVTSILGSEQSVPCNTSTFTTGAISGQSIGTAMTAAGVLGVQFRILTVSSGNTYDLNNGFVVEQAMINEGSSPSPIFYQKHPSYAAELLACQRYYEKSYDVQVAPATSTTTGLFCGSLDASEANGAMSIVYKTAKRNSGTVTFYDGAGASGVYRRITGGFTVTDGHTGGVVLYQGQSNFVFRNSTGTGFTAECLHWTVDSEF